MRSATIALALGALVAGCSTSAPVAPVTPAAPLGLRPLDAHFETLPTNGIPRVYQPDWAGPVLFAPGEKPLKIPAHRFAIIQGEWVVPKARPTINCSNPHEPEDGSSLWMGLDGWSATFIAHYKKDGKWYTYPSTDVLQAGTESDVPCYHGGPLKRYQTSAYFWIEWAGVRDIAVTRHHRDLPVHPGDKVYVRIEATTTGPHAWREATLWFVNETTGEYLPPRTFHSGCVDCGTPFQRPAKLFGNTAEWMTEATFYDFGHKSWPNTLDDFGNVTMTRMLITDQDGVTYDLTHQRDAVMNVDWMTWNAVPLAQNGTLLACSYIYAPREAMFSRAPYAIATPGQQGQLEPKPQNCRR